MPLPRVLILHNDPVLALDHPDAASEHEILYTVDAVELALREAGFPVGRLAASHDPAALLSACRQFKPDVVFNLFEGTGDDDYNEAYAAGLLHWLQHSFHGLSLCHPDVGAGASISPSTCWRSAGLPTADFMVIENDRVPVCQLDWPVIVKPAHQDASVGLDQGSVVTDQEQLELRVLRLLDTFGPPVLVEEFIPGRELNVAVVEMPELTVLPISEILFMEGKAGTWPNRHLRRQMAAGKRRLFGHATELSSQVVAALGRKAEQSGSRCFSPDRMPGLRARRFPGAAGRQTVYPGGESQSRFQPGSRSVRLVAVGGNQSRAVNDPVGLECSGPWAAPGGLRPAPRALADGNHLNAGNGHGGTMLGSLPVLNLKEKTYECTYGRGCEGVCCQNGRPGVNAEERQRIDDNLDRFLPELRPEARALHRTRRVSQPPHKMGEPMIRVADGWCVFFNKGCVLHKVGAEEGDKLRYKPMRCAVFPLDHADDGTWYLRQHGYRGEAWDLFCLAPNASSRPAVETLQPEVEIARQIEARLAGEVQV